MEKTDSTKLKESDGELDESPPTRGNGNPILIRSAYLVQLCKPKKKGSLNLVDSKSEDNDNDAEDSSGPMLRVSQYEFLDVHVHFSVCELTEVHKNAIRAVRKIKYFVARRKFQVNTGFLV